MDSHRLELEPPVPGSGSNGIPVDSANLRAIKEAFRAFTEEGAQAGIDSLLAVAHEDALFTPYLAGTRVLRGRQEARVFLTESMQAGGTIRVRAQTFEEHGDEIVAGGTIRVLRPEGGFAESQVCWTFRFHDGLIAQTRWGPRHQS